jgi:hypothetical protein
MSRTRLNLRSLSVTDKLAKGHHIVASMTNNATLTFRDASSRLVHRQQVKV